MRRIAVAFILLQSAISLTLAQAKPEILSDVNLSVHTHDAQTTFRIGKVIPLELSFTSSVENKYQLDMATYDRSGRLNEESFSVEPQAGWVDPLDLYFRSFGGFMGGGIRGMEVLSAKPVIVYLELNEWVRFDKPGEYRIKVSSSRVMPFDRALGRNTTVVSNELMLTIIDATPDWQQQTLKSALTVLNGSPGGWELPVGRDSQRDAIKALRYLGTADAAREMAHHVQLPDCRLGLAGSPARAAGLEEMKGLLTDPNIAVDGNFLTTMSVLALPDGPGERWKERTELENGFRQQLISVLQLKQNAALATSAKAILESSGTLTTEMRESLTKALIANFDNLTVQQQSEFIQYRLKGLDREILLPLLRKVAQRYKDFSELRESNAWDFNRASASALQQWYAIAPDDARPAVLQEILRPKPRFGADVLGILPDKELPEQVQSLVASLKGNDNLDVAENKASLIERYAGAPMESEILSYLDPHLGKWACAIQDPLLAWLLKVDPEQARPRLETAMTTRENTGCFKYMLVNIGKLQHSTILEEMAIKALNDPDVELVGNAAEYLGNYGTAAAEDALWMRLAAWHDRWAGHESDLNRTPFEMGVGQRMLQALACGQGWMTSEAQLRTLITLAVGEPQIQQANGFFSMWQNRPFNISLFPKGQFEIAQYHPRSLDLAKAKLLQFPKGSEFHFSVTPQDDEADALRQLSTFAVQHGFVVR